MKKSILRKLSLRAKLRGDNVEVVIINVETGEIQFEQIPLTLGTDFPNAKKGEEDTSKVSTPETDVEVVDNSEDDEEVIDDEVTSEVETDGN